MNSSPNHNHQPRNVGPARTGGRSAKQKKQKQMRVLFALGICVVAVVAVLSVTAIALLSHEPKVDPHPQFSTNPPSPTEPIETGEVITPDPYARKEGFYTFLVAGLDKISSSTDVLMIASLDTVNGCVSVVQIPRDTFLNKEVAGYSNVSRVNGIFSAAYNHGINMGKSVKEAKRLGMESLCSKLSASLCVNIDGYLLVDTESFRKVIDAVGGIDYDVPCDMDYEDPEQDLYIHLKKGYQHLDGDQCEQLIRNRSGYAGGDIERVKLRGNFMTEAFRQVLNKITVWDMVGLVPTLAGYLDTSFSVADLVAYTKMAYGVGGSNISVRTLCGSTLWDPNTESWSPYYFLNKNGALADVNECLNVYEGEIGEDLFDPTGLFTDRRNAKNQFIDDYYSS